MTLTWLVLCSAVGIGRHGVAYHEVRSKYREPQNIQESFQVSYSSSLTSSRIYVACIACVSKRSFMVVFVAKRCLLSGKYYHLATFAVVFAMGNFSVHRECYDKLWNHRYFIDWDSVIFTLQLLSECKAVYDHMHTQFSGRMTLVHRYTQHVCNSWCTTHIHLSLEWPLRNHHWYRWLQSAGIPMHANPISFRNSVVRWFAYRAELGSLSHNMVQCVYTSTAVCNGMQHWQWWVSSV